MRNIFVTTFERNPLKLYKTMRNPLEYIYIYIFELLENKVEKQLKVENVEKIDNDNCS